VVRLPEEPLPLAVAAEREVRQALAADTRTEALASVPLTVCPGGLSNHAWLAQSEGVRYFVRLSPADSARLGVDRDGECALLRAASSAGLAPAVLRCDPARRLLVTRYVEGTTWSREEAGRPGNIARLARSLRLLHDLPIDPQVGHVDFFAQARRLEAQCGPLAPPERQLRAQAAAAIESLDATAPPLTLCHNDLHHLNLIDDGARLWIVDWEYGGAGDPRFDLASFLCQQQASAEARRGLLDAYGDGPAGTVGGLEAACWLFDYVQWLWYRASPQVNPAAGALYAVRAQALLETLRAASPRALALQ